MNPSAATAPAGLTSPYVGLSFYTEDEAGVFFGRTPERQIIMGNLRGSRLTLLYAESGVGKSSLLRAGVASRLRDLARRSLARGTAVQVPVVFSNWKDDPTADLIAEIEAAVNSLMPAASAVDVPRWSLRAAIATALAALDDATAPADGSERPAATLLIILDQFEEYFQYGSRAKRDAFAAGLAECINPVDRTVANGRSGLPSDLRANFLIAIREDAYSALGDLLTSRVSNVYGNYVHLTYLSGESAKEAIEAPIEFLNRELDPAERYSIEPGLAEAVIGQVRRDDDGDRSAAGAASDGERSADIEVLAPYLQLVMTKLWEKEVAQGSHRLRRKTLDALQGTKVIVSRHLDDALAGLGPPERAVAVDALHHLVTPSGTKIALAVGDLAKYTGHPSAAVLAVLAKLAGEARILREVPPASGASDAGADVGRRFEIYHDVLAAPINAVVEERDRSDAEERAERDRERARQAEAQATREARRARRFRLIAVGAAILAGVAAVAAVEAVQAKRAAQSGQIAATAYSVVAANPELATRLALRALDIGRTAIAESALRDALPQLQLERTIGMSTPAARAAYSPNGRLVAIGARNGTVSLWNAAGHDRVGSLGAPGLTALDSVAFSPDGGRVVCTYGDGTAQVWSVDHPRRLGDPLSEADGNLTAAVFNPSGSLIATAGNAGMVRVWNARTHAQVGRGMALDDPDAEILSLAFSPDGKIIAASTNIGTVEVWDTSSHRLIRTLSGIATDPMYTAAFSPDGSQIVGANGNGLARSWSVATGALIRIFGDTRAHVLTAAAAFDRTGRLIATADSDGRVRTWAATGPGLTRDRPVTVLRGPVATSLQTVSLSPTADRVAAAGADGAGRIWDLGRPDAIAVLPPSSSDIATSAAFSPDGERVATGTYYGGTTVSSVTTGEAVFRAVSAEGDGVRAVGFSADGRSLIEAGDQGFASVVDAATGALRFDFSAAQQLVSARFDPAGGNRVLTAGSDGGAQVARVWNIGVPGRVSQVGQDLVQPNDARIDDTAYSPDGTRIVTADDSGHAYLWPGNAASAHPLGAALTVPGANPLNGVAFSHDGRAVAAVDEAGTATVWDVARPRHRRVASIGTGGDGLLAVAFSPDDKVLAVAGRDGTAGLWDIASRRQLLNLAGHDGAINRVAFSPDGLRVVTASADGTARIWSALPAEQLGPDIVEPRRQDLLTAVFRPGGRQIATASADGTARVWDALTHAQVGSPLLDRGGGHATSADYSADGSLLVTTDDAGTAVVWNATTRRPIRALRDRPLGYLYVAAFSPDRTLLVTAGPAGGRVWNLATARPVGSLAGNLRWAAFSPDGRSIVTAEDTGVAQVWSARPVKLTTTLTEPGGESVGDARFSPDGKLVVTASDDGTARIWSASSGAQIASFTEPGRSNLFTAAFGRDGRTLLTASQDGAARIWSTATGRQLTRFNNGYPLAGARFSPDGGLMVTAGSAGVARVFSTELAGPLARLESIAHRRVGRRLTPGEERAYVDGKPG